MSFVSVPLPAVLRSSIQLEHRTRPIEQVRCSDAYTRPRAKYATGLCDELGNPCHNVHPHALRIQHRKGHHKGCWHRERVTASEDKSVASTGESLRVSDAAQNAALQAGIAGGCCRGT